MSCTTPRANPEVEEPRPASLAVLVVRYWIERDLEAVALIYRDCAHTDGIATRIENDTGVRVTEADLIIALRASGLIVSDHDGTRARVAARYVSPWTCKAKNSFAAIVAKGKRGGV